MEAIPDLITWGIERGGQYTNLELGNQLMALFNDVIVRPTPDF
jgi:hypothetical protein